MSAVQTYCISFVIFLMASAAAGPAPLHAQNLPDISEVVLAGQVTESMDFFGRRIYSGMVEVRGEKRLDYIAVDVVARDSTGAVLEKQRCFIYGTRYVFPDGTISTSTLYPKQQAQFTCHLSINASDIAEYTVTPLWKEFDVLPASTTTFDGGRNDWQPPARRP